MKTSSYYDTDNFKSLINTKTNNVGVLSTNIQSINAKLNEIEMFTQELRLLNYAFSVVCIRESWLTEQDELCNIQLEDYTCISLGKTSSTKGGLIKYIQSQYKYKILQVIKNENWEGQFIEVTGGGLIKPVIIGNIYRSPRVLNCDYKKIIDEFASVLSHIDLKKSEVIIAGDFNINLLKINEKEYCSEFYDTLTGFSFFSQNNIPNKIFFPEWHSD